MLKKEEVSGLRQDTIQKRRNSFGVGTMITETPSVPVLFAR